ncbi:VanZ family protein [Salisediminibacterium beveridgei]|uniref:VanZ-like domain-containing protein n=1 Tax=Salisediminibacterium beveridgei TaxID=632773 RepID=A0A1D7QVR9_9BACI|nr:VanZ family protein [Salisediminibacterium beveridgei]AOM83069.1 hypothetical protein BBEV_1708 [Salisediminibacterium beveridgei]
MRKSKLEIEMSSSMKYTGLLLFILYLGVLFYIVFFAWNHGSSFGPMGPGGRNYNLEPGLSIERILLYSPDSTDPIRILGGNILMFVPFGMLFPFVVSAFSKKQLSIWQIIVASALLSLFIEVNQFLFTLRVANVDDVILNSLGGMIGAVVYFIFKSRLTKDHQA